MWKVEKFIFRKLLDVLNMLEGERCVGLLLESRCFLFYFSNLGEDASLPITTGGNYHVLVNNVFYFTQRVVDKLWQGMFNKESKLLVDFIIQLIAQVTAVFITLSRHDIFKRL